MYWVHFQRFLEAKPQYISACFGVEPPLGTLILVPCFDAENPWVYLFPVPLGALTVPKNVLGGGPKVPIPPGTSVSRRAGMHWYIFVWGGGKDPPEYIFKGGGVISCPYPVGPDRPEPVDLKLTQQQSPKPPVL